MEMDVTKTRRIPETVVVTGASAGFGEAIARRFVALGSKVILVARREDRLRALAADLGDQAHVIALDLTDREAVQSAFTSLPAGFQNVDCLVNNAGLALGIEPAQSADGDNWTTMIDTNCTGLVLVTRALLPGMIERGRGHVVNLGSTAGSYPYPGANVYGATKAFVHQFSLNLRSDLSGTPVRVSCVEPGSCGGTEFSEVRLGDADKARAVYAGMTPLDAEDIADAVEWITTAPAHVNVNILELMPVAQSFAGFTIHRS